MNCTSDYCLTSFQPELEYTWMTEDSYNWNVCEVYAQTIEAEDPKVTLTSCLANDYYCKIRAGVIFWKENISSECLFELVKKITLENFNDNNILVCSEENKLFQIMKTMKICEDIPVWLTT